MDVSRKFACVQLYHVSPDRNWLEIDKRGLIVGKSTGLRKAVWLCTASKVEWAIAHVAKHHEYDPTHFNIYAVCVHRNALRRIRRGIYLSYADIGRTQISVVR